VREKPLLEIEDVIVKVEGERLLAGIGMEIFEGEIHVVFAAEEGEDHGCGRARRSYPRGLARSGGYAQERGHPGGTSSLLSNVDL